MSDRLRRKLEKRRDEAIRQVAEGWLKGDGEGLDEPLHRLETCQRLLADWPRKRATKVLVAALVALLSIGIVGMAWGLRQPRSKLVLDVQTRALALRLEKPWEWPPKGGGPPLTAEAMRLDNFTSLGLRLPGANRELTGAPWARLEGGRLSLRRLGLAKGGVLDLDDVGDDTLAICLGGAAAKGRLSLSGRPAVVAGEQAGRETLSVQPELPIPETLDFTSSGGAVPACLRFRRPAQWVVRDLRVTGSLLFGSEIADAPGEPVFTSRITGGRLRLVTTSATFELEAGDPLALRGVQGRVTKLMAEPGGGIHARFTGSATEVRLGPEGYERDLRPTVLEAFYHEQQLRFFWSAVVLIWGILWSGRELLLP